MDPTPGEGERRGAIVRDGRRESGQLAETRLIMQLPFCLTSTLFEVLSRNEPSSRATCVAAKFRQKRHKVITQPRSYYKWF